MSREPQPATNSNERDAMSDEHKRECRFAGLPLHASLDWATESQRAECACLTDDDWLRCRCGKERQARYDRSMRRIEALGSCQACEMDMFKTMNMCPESLSGDGWSSACGLGWHHTGRCEPAVTREDVANAIAQRGGGGS